MYNGLDVNDLATFKMSVTFGRPVVRTLAARLGAALSSEPNAAAIQMCRLIESEPHAETGFVAQCLRESLCDNHLLAAANGLCHMERKGGRLI